MKDLTWPLFDRLRNICCGLENDNCENAKIRESSIWSPLVADEAPLSGSAAPEWRNLEDVHRDEVRAVEFGFDTAENEPRQVCV